VSGVVGKKCADSRARGSWTLPATTGFLLSIDDTNAF